MNRTIEFKTFVHAAGDAMIAADPDGVIALWNPAAERIFGFSAGEALGETLDLIIPERFRHRHGEGYRQVMSSGTTRYGHDVLRVPALHKQGHVLSVAFTVTLLFSAEKDVDMIVAVVRDETESWNQTRALRQQLKDCETRLAKTIGSSSNVP